MTRWICIFATPPGEAPQHIRDAWVGCVLPVFVEPGDPRSRVACKGVLTGKPSEERDRYLVRSLDAFAALERRNPDAARWWPENVPDLFSPGKLLGFPYEVCEPVTGLRALRLPRMTTRRWMIVTLVVAVSLTSGMSLYRSWKLGERYRLKAQDFLEPDLPPIE